MKTIMQKNEVDEGRSRRAPEQLVWKRSRNESLSQGYMSN